MKFASAIAFLAAIAAVSAAPTETNAKRMARGLPPLAPVIHDRATPVAHSVRGMPSGTPWNAGGQ
ncbi:hypothetical protein FIBSPDRAFT_957159 [Athelia psychrophila]|uniref:Uncharacterized protein n=1 Tax=Athelia psychrophila TaxID=1759441 RepID=A0A166FQ84_9AGAM|nr:hypothetical protein FIBSPDRAFT_957561 [Fibularhizoctonia sp. CBS 109695]KZP17328.1 hypothetical protein FIBSPDRAFT_957159 [Fibularhizoctonia sp. CBS 109695]